MSQEVAARHRDGRSRGFSSQGSRFRGSTHGLKHKRYVVSAVDSICGRRAEGTVRRATRRGAIGASAADRIPGTRPIHISFDTMARSIERERIWQSEIPSLFRQKEQKSSFHNIITLLRPTNEHALIAKYG